MTHEILTIDVFTKENFMGNPVAVVFDADDLTNEQMQKIANWTNLSETTFIQKPTNEIADYKLRIFTPCNELPFAGHPTLGSAYAALSKGLISKIPHKITQECKIGLVEININESLEFKLPKPKFTNLNPDEIDELCTILGAPINGLPQIVDVGPKWIIAQIKNSELTLKIKPNFGQLKIFEQKIGATGVTIFGKSDESDNFIEVRSFAPSSNIDEDPVCGSGNGSVCAYLLENALIKNNFQYIARQGRAIGRNGFINARINKDNEIFIGGQCVISQIGQINI